MTTAAMPAAQPHAIQEHIDRLGPWFHNLHLPDGTQTCPDHWLGDFPSFKWQQLAPHLPDDLTGWRALDIGCNAGFYAFELAKRSAHVLGIDADERYLTQARWAAEHFNLQRQVRFDRMQVYDLAQLDEKFDLVLFMGVFYHLRYPMLGLDLVCQHVNRLMVFQTLTMPGDEVFEQTFDRKFTADDRDRKLMLEPGWPKLAFLEHGFSGDPTNWWCANHAGVQAMLRSAGMKITGNPGHEIYLCEPDTQRPSSVATWNKAELLAATGRPRQRVADNR